MAKGGQGNQGGGQAQFSIIQIELPAKPSNGQKSAINKIIENMPMELFGYPNAGTDLLNWVRLNLPMIEQTSFYSNAWKLKEEDESALLVHLKEIAVMHDDGERLQYAKNNGLVKSLPAKALLNFSLCVEELKRLPAAPDQRQPDKSLNQQAWETAINDLEQWVNAQEARKIAVAILLVGLNGNQALGEIRKLAKMSEEQRNIYLEI